MNLHRLLRFMIVVLNSFTFSSDVPDENIVCNLDSKLVEEIASYKRIAQEIMHEIVDNGYGQDMYKEYTNFINKFGARPSGTETLENAIDHMINLTVANGLTDVATEEVVVPRWVRGSETAQMIKPHKKTIQILGIGSSVPTPEGGIIADVLVTQSFEEFEKIDIENVKGKIVVFNKHFTTYPDTVRYRLKSAVKAAEKGAVAVLVRSITPFSIYTLHTGYLEYDENVKKIPTAAITLEDANLLQRFQNNGEKIEIHINMTNSLDETTSRNTIIDLKGGQNFNKYVVVSGHIDSWDVGTGAIDDGGGMIISWFVPIILKKLKLQPKRTVRAILWTSEEENLVGARAYLKRHINELDNITFIMESDEGTFKPLGLHVGGTNETYCVIKEILKQFSPIDKLAFGGSPGSDITVFVDKGVPGASLLNKDDQYFWYHHTNADTLDVQNASDVIECAAFWAAISYIIADLSIEIPRI